MPDQEWQQIIDATAPEPYGYAWVLLANPTVQVDGATAPLVDAMQWQRIPAYEDPAKCQQASGHQQSICGDCHTGWYSDYLVAAEEPGPDEPPALLNAGWHL